MLKKTYLSVGSIWYEAPDTIGRFKVTIHAAAKYFLVHRQAVRRSTGITMTHIRTTVRYIVRIIVRLPIITGPRFDFTSWPHRIQTITASITEWVPLRTSRICLPRGMEGVQGTLFGIGWIRLGGMRVAGPGLGGILRAPGSG